MEDKKTKKKSSQLAVSKASQEKKYSRWMLVGLIVLATAVPYASSLKNGFVYWDDDVYVFKNKDIKNLDGQAVSEFFTKYYGKMYLPVTMISYALDYKIGELDAETYHRTNLILHLLNTALVFYLLYLLAGQAAIAVIAALFFGIHPLHVESVAWISERKDLLYSCFYLCGLISYVHFYNKRRRKYYFLAMLLFLLALLSKSAAVTFPVILLLIDFYKAKKLAFKNNLDKIPFFLIAIAFGILSLLSQKLIGANEDYVQGYTLIDRVFLGSYAFAYYLVKSVFPSDLSALHPMPIKANGILPVLYYLSIVVPLGFCGLLVKINRTKTKSIPSKDFLFGLLFFLFTIALILFIPVGEAVVAERYTYLPYIGLFMILGRLYVFFKDNSFPAFPKLQYCYTAAIIVTMVLFAWITHGRNKVWNDTSSLFSDVIDKNPDAGLAYNNRGSLRLEQKDFKGAMEDLNKAIELKYDDAYVNRGILKSRLGNYKNAIEDFDRAALHNKLKKDKIYYSRGVARLNLGDFKGAETDFGMAIQIDSLYADAYSNRGLVRSEKLLDLQGAIQDFNMAIRLNPTDFQVYYNRGNARLRAGNFSEALADYDRALQFEPRLAAAHFNKAAVFFKSNNLEGACRSWNKASDLGVKAAQELMVKYCR